MTPEASLPGPRPDSRPEQVPPLSADGPERLPASPRPVHLRASSVALVFVGGTLGTAAREGLTLLVPTLAGLPVALFAINLVGAFVLGLLLESLARRGPDTGVRRAVRLLVGTGMLGGFTSYSALALATDQLLADDAILRGLGFALASIVLGVLCAAAGILLASRRPPQRAAASAEETAR